MASTGTLQFHPISFRVGTPISFSFFMEYFARYVTHIPDLVNFSANRGYEAASLGFEAFEFS